MTLRSRLTVSIAAITALLTGPALYAVSRLAELTAIASAQRDTHAAAYRATGGLQTRLARMDQMQRSYLIRGGEEERAEMWASLDSVRLQLVALGDAGYAEAALRASRPVEEIASAMERLDSLMQAGTSASMNAATDFFSGPVRGLFIAAQNGVVDVAAEIDARSSEELLEAHSISQTATTTALVALGLCLVGAVLLGARTTSVITRPVRRLENAMAAVADGRFHVPADLPYDRRDEIGSVSRSFRSMSWRLAELDRMKAEFVSIATHELKTPINVISGYAELLQERVYGETTDKQDDALGAVRDQTRILNGLVNQLLDISRLEAGGLRMQFHDIVVADLFDRVRRSFRPIAEQRRIDLAIELSDAMPPTIPGDADRLRDQVLGNLLSNALKFTPEGGHVTVRSWPDDGHLVIEVQDTGPGIAADKLPFIFDKYYQVGGQARSKGAGLGLAIAHEVVQAHGGTITAESGTGEGTTFRIVLPAATAPASPRVATV
jgi:signal transduction histidine kinase